MADTQREVPYEVLAGVVNLLAGVDRLAAQVDELRQQNAVFRASTGMGDRTGSTEGLIAFLRVRLDEDEQTARVASQEAGSASWTLGSPYSDTVYTDTGGPIIAGPYADGFLHDALREHIVLHDPARVLRGVEAKRAAINEYAYLCEKALNPAPYPQPDEAGRFEVAAMMTRALAAEWNDHPDYQEIWKT